VAGDQLGRGQTVPINVKQREKESRARVKLVQYVHLISVDIKINR